MIDLEHYLMDVRKDGKVFQRTIDCVEVDAPLGQQYKPTLLDGEHLLWVVGDLIPTIVQGQLTDWTLERAKDFFNRPFPEEF